MFAITQHPPHPLSASLLPGLPCHTGAHHPAAAQHREGLWRGTQAGAQAAFLPGSGGSWCLLQPGSASHVPSLR